MFDNLFSAILAVIIFVGLLIMATKAQTTLLQKDCETMGQHRSGELHIECKIVKAPK